MTKRFSPLVVAVLALAILVNALYVQQVVSRGSLLRPLFYDSDVNQHTGCDFFALYLAGRALPRGGDIYAGNPPQKITPCCFAFRYLPVAAILGVPFSILSPRNAQLAWLLFLELLAVLCAVATFRLIGGEAGAVMAAGWLAASPLYLEFYMGQFNLVQAALLFGALFWAQRGRAGRAEAALVGGMLWKMTAWLALPSLIIHRRWRTVIAGALIAVGSLLLYGYFTGQSLSFFWRNFQPDELVRVLTRGDLGLPALLHVLAGDRLPGIAAYVVPGAVVLLTLLIALRGREASLSDHLALWFTAYFFVYPTVWEHHYLLLLPSLVYLFARTRWAVLYLPLLLLALPTPYLWAGPRGAEWQGYWPLLYHGSKLAAALLVYLVAALNLWRGGRGRRR